jgi:hypothetical protein
LRILRLSLHLRGVKVRSLLYRIGILLGATVWSQMVLASANCTAGYLCGTVTSKENSNALVGGIRLQIKNPSTGAIAAAVVTSATADAAGHNYSVAVAGGQTYLVTPAVNRNQSSAPALAAVAAPQSADFSIRGLTAVVNFQKTAGTYLLLTPTQYIGATAPVISAGSSGGPYYAQVADAHGTATLEVPPGSSYWLTQWTPSTTLPVTFTRCQKQLCGGGIFNPDTVVSSTSTVCP